MKCTLPADRLAERLAWIRDEILPHAQRIERLESGIAWELAEAPGLAEKVDRLIALERECCEGIVFERAQAEASGRLRLEMRGVDPDAALTALAAPGSIRNDPRMGRDAIAGGCLCGAVRFEITGALDRVAHCHCTICQRAHGAAFVTWAAVPADRLRITAGEAGIEHYRSSEIGTRSFCRTCGSSMFCTLDTHPGVIDVTLGCLAPDHGAVPRAHMFWDDRAHWLELTDRLPRLGGKSGSEPR